MLFLLRLYRQSSLQRLGAVCSVVALLAACSGSGNSDDDLLRLDARDYCTELQSANCLYPFPSNLLTRADSSSATGVRVNFNTQAMPKNASGVIVDPAEWNRNDGFSPGTTMLAQVPGLDVARTGLPTLAHQQRSLDADSPVVVFDADSGQRQLVWAELNSDPLPAAEVALLIHPAKSFEYGHRYIVALRNMKNADGKVIDAEAVFRAYREGQRFTSSTLENRRAAMDDIFTHLATAGVARDDGLFLAWDFTVASSDNISGRIVHMRDETLAALNGAAPEITITSVTLGSELADENQKAHLARLVRGTIDVPNYLDTADGGPGARFHYDSGDVDAMPTRLAADAVLKADFVCAVPNAAMTPSVDEQLRARPVIMAHGLYQNREMVPQFAAYADANNLVLCGMNWIGMTSDDGAITAQILGDFSKFATLPDRLQQAYLNNMLLTRALLAADGLATRAAFRMEGRARSLFNNDEVYFEAISQGAVLGGGFYAVSPDIHYGSLASAGMNFSLLMQRSDAWPAYRALFQPAYPNGLDQSLLLAMIQMLWDRGEIDGYAATLNPTNASVPGAAPKLTLIQSAVGDKTVTETAAEILARTIGALQHVPRVVAGRHIGDVPYIDINAITYPSLESGYTVWDRGPFPHLLDSVLVDGTPLQLEGNAPNMLGENPHVTPIRDPLPMQQRAALIWQHQIINVCGDTACLAEGYDGTPGEYNPANAPSVGEAISM